MAAKGKTKWMNRVWKHFLKDLGKVLEHHHQGKNVDLSRWGNIENLEWVIQLMKQFLQE